MVRKLAGQAQAGQIQALGRDVHIIIGVDPVQQRLTINRDAAIGVIHGQGPPEIITLLIHIGSDIVVTVALEVDERDMALQVT